MNRDKRAKIYYFLGHEQFQPEKLVEDSVTAEEVGFDGLFVSEHFNPWVSDLGAAGFALATIGAIAERTKKIELMTGVISPLFRFHPAVVAQAAATLDRLSGGRFYLGVGTGESINEVPLGYDFPGYVERSERMKEALIIMEKLLGGEKINYNGKFYAANNVKLYSPPLKRVPTLLAAGGPKSAVIAAHYSDGIIVSVKNPHESLEKIINPYIKEATEKNKIPEIVTTRWTIFAKNKEDAFKAISPWRGLRAPQRHLARDPEHLQEKADSMETEDILSRYTLVKNPDDYIRAYSPLISQLKADTVVIQTTSSGNQKDLIRLLGKHVLPALKKYVQK